MSTEKFKSIAKKYASFIGPGIMISVAYMDPGNYSTGVVAGANNRFSLLFFVLVSNFMANFLQSLCIKLGTVTGYDLARCCREYLPKKLNYVLWFLAECAIIATDVAEVIGSAIALNILLRIPLPAGVVITIVDVLVVLAAYRSDQPLANFIRFFEYAVALLVLGVVVCFAALLAYLPEDSAPVGTVFRGFAPSKEMTKHGGLGIATSIIGATVMIHSLFLGSGIVQPRLREYDLKHKNLIEPAEKDLVSKEKLIEYIENDYKPLFAAIKYCYKYSVIELVVTLMTFAVFVNASIVIVAGGSLYGTPQAADADLYAIHDLLLKVLAPVAGTIFMLALLFSGQSAGIVCTIAGQMVSEGHLNWTCKPWIRRLATRGIAIIPCLVISLCIGRLALNAALNVSQVVISLLLPPLMLPLIYFTSSKKIMRVELSKEEMTETSNGTTEDMTANVEDCKRYHQMENSWFTTVMLVLVWLFVSGLNIYSIVDMARSGIYLA
uniref:Metal ion transporter n=1 Tax=Candidozyma auris TaxID=498019 RepID=A0A0L0NRF7_CANAR